MRETHANARSPGCQSQTRNLRSLPNGIKSPEIKLVPAKQLHGDSEANHRPNCKHNKLIELRGKGSAFQNDGSQSIIGCGQWQAFDKGVQCRWEPLIREE